MELGFTCNSATNGNCTQISWLVNVLTKIQSSLHFSLHSRLRAFPVMCLPGFIPIWETEFSRVRMFPDKHIPEFIHSPIRAGIFGVVAWTGEHSTRGRAKSGQFRDSNRNRSFPGNIFLKMFVSRENHHFISYSICNAAKKTKTKKTITIQ